MLKYKGGFCSYWNSNCFKTFLQEPFRWVSTQNGFLIVSEAIRVASNELKATHGILKIIEKHLSRKTEKNTS